MKQDLATDLSGELDKAVAKIATEADAKVVRSRLEFLLWRVMVGQCTDFFEIVGEGPNGLIYNTEPVRVETHTIQGKNGEETYTRQIYSKSPQFKNFRVALDSNGQIYSYIHCIYKGQ